MTEENHDLLSEKFENEVKKSQKTTFTNNMKLPIHRWYRYSAGFSAEWVEDILKTLPIGLNVYDPFAGSGTVMIAADKMGFNSIGVDPHPFVSKMTSAKLGWNISVDEYQTTIKKVLNFALKANEINISTDDYPPLIEKSYSKDNLAKLDALKHGLETVEMSEQVKPLIWFTLATILRSASGVGTAQWQYILPTRKTHEFNAFDAFKAKADQISEDMIIYQKKYQKKSKFLAADARNAFEVPENWADIVITSPPYANNYDYADATRLEMSFFGTVQSWGDLQEKVRKYLIRSSTQSVSKLKDATFDIAKDDLLSPIYSELQPILEQLLAERETHGGKKNYHTMIVNYFLDMAKVMHDLRRVVKQNGEIIMVIGDSAPYGIYIPVDRWLGELALSQGFTEWHFAKERDRNIKWKNRIHTVPLKEGYLTIKG